jgi:ATP-binding cassette, subfamily B, bacterial
LKRAGELLALLIRMYRLLWNISPTRVLVTAVCRLLLSLFPVANLYVLSLLVNAVTQVITADQPFHSVWKAVLLQVGLAAAAAGIRSLDRMVMAYLKMNLQYDLENRMAEKSARLPLVYFDRPDFYDSYHRAMASQSSVAMIDTVSVIIQGLITVTGYFAVLASFHWLLSVGLLVFVMPSLIVNLRLGQKRFLQMVFQTPTARKAQYWFGLLVGREAAKEIRLFGLAAYLLERWRSSFWINAKQQLKLENKATVLNGGLELLGSILSGVLVLGLAWLGSIGRLTLGQYVALAEAFAAANSQLMSISSNMALIYQNVLFSREIFTFLDLTEDSHPPGTLSPPKRMKEGIEADNIAFLYPGSPNPVIQNIHLRIDPGQKVAIVGDNGAGKSTLVKCLLGLYSLSDGSITYDGIDIRDLDPSELRKRVTAVFQDYVRYQCTVRENIGFGDVDRLHDDSWLEAAAAQSGSDEVIDGFAHRFEAMLGPTFEGGRELSQGQWQRLAISRAYFRDAKIVILDEPTASMDPITEAAIFENFLRIAEGKTTILISHRLGICKAVDVIFVMKNGQIIERGTHEELLRLGGEYHQMFQLQSKWYETSGVTA